MSLLRSLQRALLVVLAVVLLSRAVSAVEVMYSGAIKGPYPYAALTLGPDGSLYGTSTSGGAYEGGTIFKVSASGEFTVLHSFRRTDGAVPRAELLLAKDGDFYGTTSLGGANGAGTVFKITPSGELTVLHSFNGADGAEPCAGLIHAYDGYLYGTTRRGGVNDFGSVFKISLVGEFALLGSFDHSNGAYPEAGLMQASDGNLYGTTTEGGGGLGGTVFRVTPAGGLTALSSFYFQHFGGIHPRARLVEDADANLYGTTKAGAANYGAVFRFSIADRSIRIVHAFSGEDGGYPTAGLVLGGDGAFYGTTSEGGKGRGTLFRITTSGELTSLHAFDGADGSNPQVNLIRGSDGYLCGVTSSGGANGNGVIFNFAASRGVTVIHSFKHTTGASVNGGIVRGADGDIYGVTNPGGTNNAGAVFKLGQDGTLSIIHSFAGPDGARPCGGVVQADDGDFYGTTLVGGMNGLGTVYAITPAGDLRNLHSFNGADGARPATGLIQATDGSFYGSTSGGGANDLGTLFRITPTGDLTTIHTFNGENGAEPGARLLQASDGYLYGTTSRGGAANCGTIFRITPDGAFESLYSFDAAAGSYPSAQLLEASDGRFYGTAYRDGAKGAGTIFRITSTGSFEILHSFDGPNGSTPNAPLIQLSDGMFYGTTSLGGESGCGSVYRMTSDGKVAILHSFETGTVPFPSGACFFGSDQRLYGSSSSGLNIWRMDIPAVPDVQTGLPLNVASSSADVSGTVLAHGADTSVNFEYGSDAEYGNSVAATPSSVTGHTLKTVTATLPGLRGHTIYHYRVKATNGRVTMLGEDATFTTPNGPPVANDSKLAMPTGTAFYLRLPFELFDADGDTVTVQSLEVEEGAPFTVGNVGWNGLTVYAAEDKAGSAKISFTVRDGFGGFANGSVLVTVTDETKPLFLHNPTNLTVEATSAKGAEVNYSPVAVTDNVGVVALDYSKPSGSIFALGETPVNVTARDAAGNETTASFVVTVSDTTRPVFLSVSSDITVEATSNSGAQVMYAPASATDAVSEVVLSYSRSRGTWFAMGITQVTVTARDAADNFSFARFNVTVQDTTAPVFLSAPKDVTVEATSASGAVVNYPSIWASDSVSNVALSYSRSRGSLFPIGSTPVTVTARDAAGNERETSFDVTVQDTTAPVFFSVPKDITVEATSASGAVVNYPPATADDSVSSVTLSYSRPSGLTFPIGFTPVTVTARDVAGNEREATFTVIVQDSTAPTIAGSFAPLRVKVGDPLPDYRAQAETNDTVGVVNVLQSPVPGVAVLSGITPVILTAFDAAGNEASTSFQINGSPVSPESELLAIEGDGVPGAGIVAGIPEGAIWESFGVPCITNSGLVAFSSVVRAGKLRQRKILLHDPQTNSMQVLASAGDPVPKLPESKFVSFDDPIAVTTGDGNTVVAFQATIGGTDVKRTTRNVVCRFSAETGLELIGRTGVTEVSAEEGGASVRVFTSFGLAPDGVLLAVAKLAYKKGGGSKAGDQALLLWALSSKLPRIVLRARDTLGTAHGEKVVSTVATLAAASGSTGHGRWTGLKGLTVRVNFTDRSSGIYVVGSDGGDLSEVVLKDESILLDETDIPAQWAAFGLPALDDAGGLTFMGRLTSGAGKATQSDFSGIFRKEGEAWVAIARTGLAGVDGALPQFTSFKDPVSNANAAVAFVAAEVHSAWGKKLQHALWFSTIDTATMESDGSISRTLKPVARVGGIAPGAGVAVFAGITSVALPDGENTGPLFVANLAGKGVSRSNNSGLWSVDAEGLLHLVVRTGFPVAGLEAYGQVRRFTALKSVRDSPGQARAYNDQHEVICRVEFDGRKDALVKITLP